MFKKIKFFCLIVIVILVASPFFLKPEKTFFSQNNIENSLNIKTTLINIANKNVVYVKCKFKNAGILNDSPDKHGISRIYAELIFRKFNGLSNAEIKEKFQVFGVTSLIADASKDDLELSFYVLKNKMIEALNFVGLAIANNQYSKNELEYVKQKFPNLLNIETASPVNLISEKLMKILYKNHSYGLNTSGTAQAIAGITIDDIENFISSKISRKNLEVVFAGDISKFEINNLLKYLFEKIPESSKDSGNTQTISKLNVNSQENAFAHPEIIKRKNLNDIVGVICGIRIDAPSLLDRAAILVILSTLFDTKNGDFITSLQNSGIAHTVSLSILKRKLSHTISFYTFINKKDLNTYLAFLEKKISNYRNKINIKNFETAQTYFCKQSEKGFENIYNIDENIEEKFLPFRSLNLAIYKKMNQKIFDQNQVRLVIIGDL